MKFSGHETFHIREGWLHKGLSLLWDDTESFRDKYVYDEIGVGSNMAKSIRHWLVATSLTDRKPRGELVPTDLAKTLWVEDPYFEDPFTWWILHLELVANRKNATTWNWFFNSFNQKRFEKEICVTNLHRYATREASRCPSIRTLERDVSTLLSTYAQAVPIESDADPEESYDCPLQELGLMTDFRETHTFRVNFEEKAVPGEAVGYSLAKSCGVDDSGVTEVLFDQVVSAENSPAKSFCLYPTNLFELIEESSGEIGEDLISTGGLAGQRTVRYRSLQPLEWVKHYFRRKKK